MLGKGKCICLVALILILWLPRVGRGQCNPKQGQFSTALSFSKARINSYQFSPYGVFIPVGYKALQVTKGKTLIYKRTIPSYSDYVINRYTFYGPNNEYLIIIEYSKTLKKVRVVMVNLGKSPAAEVQPVGAISLSNLSGVHGYASSGTDQRAVFLYFSYTYSNGPFYILCSETGKTLCSYTSTYTGTKAIYAEATATTVRVMETGNTTPLAQCNLPSSPTALIAFSTQKVKFTNVKAGDPTSSQYFKISNNGTKTLSVNSIQLVASTYSGMFSVSPSSGSIASKGFLSVNVTFTAPSGTTPATYSAKIKIEHKATNMTSPQYVDVEGIVVASPVPVLTLTPTSAKLTFSVESGKTSTPGSFQIKNTGTTNLIITNVQSDNPTWFKLSSGKTSPTIAPNGTEPYQVIFNPSKTTTATKQTFTGKINITCSNHANAAMQLAGELLPPGKKSPAIDLFGVSSLHFGKNEKDCKPPQPYKIFAIGNSAPSGWDSLKINSIAFSDPLFKLDPTHPNSALPVYIYPGSSNSKNFKVIFDLQNAAKGTEYDETMTITHTDPTKASLNLSLKADVPSANVEIKWWKTKAGSPATLPAYTSEDIWITDKLPADPKSLYGKPFPFTNAPSIKVGKNYYIFARFRNQAKCTNANKVDAKFWVADNVGAMHFDPNRDGDPKDQKGSFKVISAQPVVVAYAANTIADAPPDGTVDKLIPGKEAIVYVKWTPASGPTSSIDHRCVAVQLASDPGDKELTADKYNNIAQENLKVSSIKPSMPDPQDPFQSSFSFEAFNPFPEEPTHVQLAIDGDLPGGWEAVVEPTDIDFQAGDLMREGMVTVTIPPYAEIGDQVLLGVASRLPEDEDAFGGFSALIEIASFRERLLGDVTDNGEVTAYDASRVLGHTVGLGPVFTEEDSIAADVSGRIGISAFDASLLLQYVVGKIRIFPVEEGGVVDPPMKSLAVLRNISVGEAAPRGEGGFRVPILLDDMDGVVAGEVTLSFEGHGGDEGYVEVRSAALTSEYLLASNVQDGLIRVSFAGAESSVGSGPVLDVVFDGSSVGLLRSLRLDHAVLNEGRIPVQIVREAETPGVCRLAQNYPNPFNPETVLRYDVAEAGAIHLAVYALNGQHIRTLVDGERSAGRYSVRWDGTDDAGRDVASGVYLCRMKTDDFRAVRKLLAVR